MQPITVLDTLGVALAAANVDTDQLIPARFMKEPRSVGYGQFLLYDVRHDEQGTPDASFILHRPGAGDAEVMVSRRNFGAGSSREAAVYAIFLLLTPSIMAYCLRWWKRMTPSVCYQRLAMRRQRYTLT